MSNKQSDKFGISRLTKWIKTNYGLAVLVFSVGLGLLILTGMTIHSTHKKHILNADNHPTYLAVDGQEYPVDKHDTPDTYDGDSAMESNNNSPAKVFDESDRATFNVMTNPTAKIYFIRPDRPYFNAWGDAVINKIKPGKYQVKFLYESSSFGGKSVDAQPQTIGVKDADRGIENRITLHVKDNPREASDFKVYKQQQKKLD